MPSNFTTSARFTLQATGENNNTWGAILNQGVFQLVDDNVNGRLGFALSGAKTLVTANGATDEARMKFLDVTGGSGGTITIPAAPKGYYVRNASAGNVVVSAGGATTATLKAGDIQPVFSDGASVYNLRIAGQSLQDYIASAITGTGQLPPAAGNLGMSLTVQNIGAGPQWLPGLITGNNMAAGAAAANLGYTAANKAGDSFTGPVSATTLAAGSVTPYNFLRLDSDGTNSTLWFNYNAGSYLNYKVSNGLLTYAVNNTQVMSLDLSGNFSVNQSITASRFNSAAGTFLGDANLTNLFFDNSLNSYLSYLRSAGSLTWYYHNTAIFQIDAAGNANFVGTLTAGNNVPSNNSVSTAKIQDGAVTTAKLAAGAVGNAQMAGGAAQANIGYTPVNRAGDTVTGNFTVNGAFNGLGQVKGYGGLFAGASGRLALGGDDSTYGRVYLDTANGCFIHCNWNTGKLSFYIGNTIVASLDSAGNFVVRGTFAYTTVPTP